VFQKIHGGTEMSEKTDVRRLECTLCDWHTDGFKKDIPQKTFLALLKKTHKHIRDIHEKRSTGKYIDMPFMPNDYPLETPGICPCCGQSINNQEER